MFSKKSFVVCLLCFFVFAPVAFANEKELAEKFVEWEFHPSVTNAFDVKFPQKYKYKIFPFMYNKSKIAFSGQILSTLDGSSANKDRSLLVKVVQTFGAELTHRQIREILDREVKKYENTAQSIGGKLVSNEDVEQKGFPGKNMFIAYEHGGEKYGIRIRLFVTDYSKIEQVLTGKANAMYSFRADDFFDSLEPKNGITSYKGNAQPGAGWIKYTSKNNVFSVVLPPKNEDYAPNLPAFGANATRGVMQFEIEDPVLKESAYFNVYSYKLGKKATYQNVKPILFTQHIGRFVPNASMDSLETDNTKVDGYDVMKARLVISPIKKYPHVSVVVLEANYSGDTLVVKEFLSNASHSLSDLHNTLFGLTEFHPEKYDPVQE